MVEARAHRVLGLVPCLNELVKVELSVAVVVVLMRDVDQVVVHTHKINIVGHAVHIQLRRDRAEGLCTCAAAWHLGSIDQYG